MQYTLEVSFWHVSQGTEAQHLADSQEEQQEDVLVEPVDFWDALRELRPSLSREELARYEALRLQYEGKKSAT